MKMMAHKIPVFLMVAVAMIALGACKKSDPQLQTSAQPVFALNANVNGAPVSLQAGVNNYYMYTSYFQDTNSVYHFMGDLKPFNCANCLNALHIDISDYEAVNTGANANIGTSLSPGYYAFQIPGGAQTQYPVSFSGYPQNVTPQSWAWDLGDGTSSNQQSPSHQYSRPGNYTVTMLTTFTDQTVSGQSNVVSVGTPQSGFVGGFGSNANGNTVTFSSSLMGTPPYSFTWDFGDGSAPTVTTATSVVHTYSNNGLYKVHLVGTDAANHVLDCMHNSPTQNYTGSIANFYFTSPANPVPNPSALSNVVIRWTDNNGVTWTSSNSAQPSTSYFRVLSVDPYNTNNNGQSTKKIHALVKCTLYNGSNSILLDNADVVFGVAYH